MFLLSCSSGEHLPDTTLPNVYAKIYRESADPTAVYARDIRLTTQGEYDPELDHGIYGAVVSVDGVICSPALSPAYQYYSDTPIPTSPGTTHTLSATIEGVAYMATLATPGAFTASCDATYAATEAVAITYSFTGGSAGDNLKVIVSSSDSSDGSEHLIDIEPDGSGTVSIPAGTLAIGTDRYIQVVVSNTTRVETASEKSFFRVIQIDGLYVEITE